MVTPGLGLGLKLVSHACSQNGGKRGVGAEKISLVAKTLIYDKQGYFLLVTSVKLSVRVLFAGQLP